MIAMASFGQSVLETKVLDGQVHAPEFPRGLAWLNTAAPLELGQWRGKFVLLDFWTFCCINCMHILPDLKRLEKKYPQELVVLGVHSAKFDNEKDTRQIREAILRYEIRHPVVNDAEFAIWRSYAVRAWPTVVLINPLGRVIGTMSGEGVFGPIDNVLTQAIPYFEKKGALQRSPLRLELESAARAESLLAYPGKISADGRSGRLFVTDSNHHRVLVTDAAGKVMDVIGGGGQGQADGGFAQAEFHHPQGTALAGEVLYIADTENHLIRAANLRTRQVTTLLGTGEQARRVNAGGTGRAAALNSPWDLLVREGKLYIAMAGPHQVWVADPRTGEARPYAGSGAEGLHDGPRLEAVLAQPSGITAIGDRLYFADSETSSVRTVAVGGEEAVVETVIGQGLFDFGDIDGPAARARLQHPLGVAARDGLLYVADTYNSRIKVVDPERRTSAVLAGSGRKGFGNGALGEASFDEPGGLAWLGGKLYVADTNNHLIRVIDPKAKSVSTLVLSGVEKLAPASRAARFAGRSVELGPVTVAAAGAELVVSFALPEGYHHNDAAPFSFAWSAAPAGAITFGAPRRPAGPARLPVRVPLGKVTGPGKVTIETVVYYCTSEESVCLVDPIRATVEVRPAADGAVSVPLRIAVRPGAAVR